MKQVSKPKFDAFIKSYPGKLEIDITAICEPPQKSYNDFTLGRWPESMVAQVRLCKSYGEPDRYYISELAVPEWFARTARLGHCGFDWY